MEGVPPEQMPIGHRKLLQQQALRLHMHVVLRHHLQMGRGFDILSFMQMFQKSSVFYGYTMRQAQAEFPNGNPDSESIL